jgi:ABC-type branched-subunit amino acid transport system substrate-binding protein
MKGKFVKLLTVLMMASMFLAACGSPATQAPAQPAAPAATEAPAMTEAPAATEAPAMTEAPVAKTVTIGFTTSQTGSLNVESTRQTNGLKLWMDQVNQAGGVTLADGTVVTFQAQSYDDESSADRVQELYTKLATEDNADFLISPYSSGLTAKAAVISEQYGKVMITTGAAADSAYQQGYTLVYQAYTPASHYLTGAVDLLANSDPSAKTIAIAYSNDSFSTSVVEALKTYAEGKGYNVPVYEGYDPATTDFSALINKIQAAAPDAIMGGGHFQDGSTFAKQLAEKNVAAKMVALLVAPPEPSFAELGDAALGVVGPSQWEPEVAFTPDFGPTGTDFVDAYKAAYNEDPSYHSAGGYAAGLILQKAIETAGSLDNDAIKQALDGMDMTIFYGHIKFDTSADNHGLQIGHEMVYVQWQKDDSGNLVKQIVWPESGATAPVLYPLH